MDRRKKRQPYNLLLCPGDFSLSPVGTLSWDSLYFLLCYFPSFPHLSSPPHLSRYYFQNASLQTQNAPPTCSKEYLCLILAGEFGGAGNSLECVEQSKVNGQAGWYGDSFPSETACLGKGKLWCLNGLLIKAWGQEASQDFPQECSHWLHSAWSGFSYAASRL